MSLMLCEESHSGDWFSSDIKTRVVASCISITMEDRSSACSNHLSFVRSLRTFIACRKKVRPNLSVVKVERGREVPIYGKVYRWGGMKRQEVH